MALQKDASSAAHSPSIEWWYAAQFSFGAVHSGFFPILVPTYIISITGRAADVGIVMSVMGLGAFLAPFIGGFADKYRAYCAAQLGGLALQAVGALIFALTTDVRLLAAGGAVLGIGTGTLMMINPSFILGSGFSREKEANRLTRLNQTGRIGQLLGALAVAGLTQAGMSFSARFLAMSGVAAACLVVAAATNRQAAARIKRIRREPARAAAASAASLRSVLRSAFGVFLLGAIWSRAGLEMFFGQYPNYMQDVFQIGPALSATAISVAALLTLLVLELSGRWMGRSGPCPVWLAAVSVPVGAAAVLIVMALWAPVPAVLPLGVYVLLRFCMGCINLTQPPLARSLSSTPLGTTQGILLFVLVIGFIAGNLGGGWLADLFGFASLPWALAGVTLVAMLLGILATIRGRSRLLAEANV